MTRGTTLAGLVAGATALTTGAAVTAYACTPDASARFVPTTGTPTTARTFAIAQHDKAAVLGAHLARVAAFVDAVRAKVDAIPSDTVLAGEARERAQHKLAIIAGVRAFFTSLPTTGVGAPTPAERATIDAIDADLAAIAAKVKTLMANTAPVVTPTSTTTTKLDVLGLFFGLGGHHCDGDHDGRVEGTRFSRWDGWRHHH